MTTRFARRMEALKASEIREILKVTQRPEVISFAGGLPAPELFPVKTLAAATQKVFEEDGMRALQYSTTEGHAPLRRKIAERMRATWDAHVTPDQILVTSGSQQGLDLTGQAPPRRGGRRPLREPDLPRRDLRLERRPPALGRGATDDDGMDPAALEETPRAPTRPRRPSTSSRTSRTRRAAPGRSSAAAGSWRSSSGTTSGSSRTTPTASCASRGPRSRPSSPGPEGARPRARHLLEGLLPGPAHRLDRRREPGLREARHPQAGGRPADLDARPAPGEPLPRGERPRRRHRADPPRLPRAARRDARRARRGDARRASPGPAPRAASSSG